MSSAHLRRVGVLLAVLVAVAVFSVTAGAGRPSAGDLQSNSDMYQQTRELLPQRFLDYETRRFIVISDAAPGWSRQQAALLERTYHQFNRFARRLDVKPLPLRHKLVCVLFRNRKEFNAFAAAHDHLNLHSWNLGYYSQRNDRIVLFDGTSEKDADEITKERTVATAIHEAVHQLH